jgi:Fe-S cluster assembly ATP-binding protein
MSNILEIKNLSVTVGSKKILDKLNLDIKDGEICVVMGPNGSGKSTLVNTIMGHPDYKISSGQIIFKGIDITSKGPEERAALGLFMSFQNPREINGLDFYPFLFDAYRALQAAQHKTAVDVFSFKPWLDEEMARLKISTDWSERSLNQGFSGGEKKKSEMLQLALFKPTLALFDEIDSGLDVDALEIVGQAIKRFKTPKTSALIITHYQKILEHVRPNKVVVMNAGKIIKSGGYKLALQLEKEGFKKVLSALN